MKKLWSVFTLFLVVAAAPARAADSFSAADVYRTSAPSVVLIFGFNSEGEGSAGTGSIVSRNGLILTNNHVIYDASRETPYPKVTVYFKPRHITGHTKDDLKLGVKARVIARDESMDLALLRVERIPSSAKVIHFGDSEHTEIGSPVAAIGHPGGGGLWTLTTGTISSTRLDGSRAVFQTDTAINPGNSGGPLLDGDAKLIGINTYVKRVNAQGLPLEGLNYSLRSEVARRWLAGLGLELDVSSSPAAAAPARSGNRNRGADSQASRSDRSRSSASPGVAPRSYRTPGGEMAFGVPNFDFNLEGELANVVGKAKKNASGAFDELDEMSMDLDEEGF